MGMLGNLKDMAIADLIQHNCQDRKVAQLTIQHAGQRAVLYFNAGNVSHAVLDDQEEGEAVIYHILGWEDGTFNLEAGVTSPAVSITRSWTGLLLEGARRLDENKLEESIFFAETPVQPEVNQMAQKLDDVLKEMSGEINGYIASVVVGMDGLCIAEHRQSKVDPEVISAQMTLLFKLVDTTTTRLKAGALEDHLLTTRNALVLMRYLPDKQYFLGLVVDRKGGNLGNARLISKMFSDRLAKAMPH